MEWSDVEWSDGAVVIYVCVLHNSVLSSTMQRCAVEFLLCRPMCGGRPEVETAASVDSHGSAANAVEQVRFQSNK